MFAANSGASSMHMKGQTKRISSISHNSRLTEHRGSSSSFEKARIAALLAARDDKKVSH